MERPGRDQSTFSFNYAVDSRLEPLSSVFRDPQKFRDLEASISLTWGGELHKIGEALDKKL